MFSDKICRFATLQSNGEMGNAIIIHTIQLYYVCSLFPMLTRTNFCTGMPGKEASLCVWRSAITCSTCVAKVEGEGGERFQSPENQPDVWPCTCSNSSAEKSRIFAISCRTSGFFGLVA